MNDQRPPTLLETLIAGSAPMPVRVHLLRQLVEQGDEENLCKLLKAATRSKGKSRYDARTKELEALISQLEDGPLRVGTYLRAARGETRRAVVRLPDGSITVSVVLDEKLARRLRRGDAVGLDARCKAVLHALEDAGGRVGEEARLERVLDPTRVEVSLREGGERHVFHTAADLEGELADGAVETGRALLVEPQQRMAFAALPAEDGTGDRRYLDGSPPPDVVVERDVGAPPAFLDELTEHVEREMLFPERARRYGLRRCAMQLLTGVPGSGKTLAVHALWRRMYEVMGRATGADPMDLPPRVMRFRASTVLSKWLGESDKHIDRFFDELDSLADERWVDADGREHELPVLAVFEEIDGVARVRGEDSVHDRIQTTLLQRLDVTAHPRLGGRLVLFLFTTNCPELVDPAFQRRAGARVCRFGRLDRAGFEAVLEKLLARRPMAGANGRGQAAARAGTVARLAGWLFAPSDAPVVELDLVGRPVPARHHRRDFLTGGLVDRAVQEAADEACRGEAAGEPAGIDAEHLAAALERQVAAVVDQLRPENARRHLELPDGVRVGAVRRLPRPHVLPAALERA